MEHLAELYDKFPQFFDSLGQDPVNEEPILSYITEIETRRDIFQEFQRLARVHNHWAPALNAVALGIVMVAPVDQLQSRLEAIENAGPPPLPSILAHGTLDYLCGHVAIRGIRACE